MAQPIIQTSYASGELSPTLFARVDLAKWHIGAATLRNFFVDYRGGITNRAGTKFVGYTSSSNTFIRLIPFSFSTIQTYMLEFGNLKMRVIKNGAYVLESTFTITGITQANPGVVTTSSAHGFSNGELIYIVSVNGMTQVNGRFFLVGSATTNTFALLDPASAANINTSTYTAYSSGGTVARVYTLTIPYTTSDLADLKYSQDDDTLTITHPSYQTREITRSSDASWTISLVSFDSNVARPGTPTAISNGTAPDVLILAYKVTAVNENEDESLPSFPVGIYIEDEDLTSIKLTWTAVPNAVKYNIYRANPASLIYNSIDGPATLQTGLYGYVDTVYVPMYTETSDVTGSPKIIPDYSKGPPIHFDPFAPGQISQITITNPGTGLDGTTTTTITDPTGTGAVIRPIVNLTAGGPGATGGAAGIIIEDGGSGYTSPSLNFSPGSGLTVTFTISPLSGTYPAVNSYFQQRRVFAASNNFPQNIWMTRIGKPSNLDVSDPIRDDDSITITLTSLQVNAIKHLIPMPGGLIALTEYGAWQVSGGAANAAVTPSNVVATPQAYIGAADITPLVINYNIVFVQARGTSVRKLAYDFNTNIYNGTDISVLSNHLFVNHQILDWTWAEEPHKLIWAVRNDGNLVSCTFLDEQELIAWAHHDTFGQFISCASIVEGTENVVYFVVRRVINGRVVQFTERMASRQLRGNIENSWFVDCGLETSITTNTIVLTPTAATGTGITFTAASAIFSAGDVGKIIRGEFGGKATITGFTSNVLVTATITEDFPTYQDEEGGIPISLSSWTLASVVSSVGGLWHLEGMEVVVFGDGDQLTSQTVTNGTVAVSTPSSIVRVGLSYTAQFQSLYLDVQGSEPTVQGKRKSVRAITQRFVETRGTKIGQDFDNLYLQKQSPGIAINDELYTGDVRANMATQWDTYGQYCLQQDAPYPVTLLGAMPEIIIGDTR